MTTVTITMHMHMYNTGHVLMACGENIYATIYLTTSNDTLIELYREDTGTQK